MSRETLIDLDQEGGEFAEKLLKYRKIIGIVVVSASLVLALVLRFALGGSQAEKEFLQAEELFSSWESASDIDEGVIAELAQAMKQHPELAEKFGSSIAQRYLALEHLDEAGEFKKYLLDERLSIKSPYSAYAEGSYLIATGKYDEALARTLSLKEDLQGKEQVLEQNAYGKDLYAFTLLRLANLHQELKNSKEELAVWNELKQFFADHNTCGQVIINHLTDQKISLHDFIASRQALLGA